MAIFDAEEFTDHEHLAFAHDKHSGLRAIIAIHDTTLGPALGGCRMFPYLNDEQALHDALRLSRGMTYKSALAHLPLGGGKSVIMADPSKDKKPALFKAMGRFVNRMSGNYIIAQDSGIMVEDLTIMGSETPFVAGIIDSIDDRKQIRSGDPSPATAYGVFKGIQAAVHHKWKSSDLKNLRVAIQGVGNVGFSLAKHLHAAGAEIFVSDINPRNLEQAASAFGATIVDANQIYALDVDVYSPCALGGAINQFSICAIKAPIIAGSANNQLDKAHYGEVLHQEGKLYAPDFVISAGGIIHVHFMRCKRSWEESTQHVERIYDTLLEIFTRSTKENKATASIANSLAKERIAKERHAQSASQHKRSA